MKGVWAMDSNDKLNLGRRSFIQGLGVGAAALGVFGMANSLNAADLPRDADGNVIPGFGEDGGKNRAYKPTEKPGKWVKKSDRKIRVV